MKSETLEMFLFVKRLKTKFNYVKKVGVHLHTNNRKFTATFNKC